MGRDRDASSVLAGYRDMLGHDQALEAAKRRAREREAYRKKAQKDEADLRVMLYTAPERETPVPSAPSASAPRAAKRRKRNRHEIAAEEDAAYMRKKRVVDAAGLRLIESEDEEDEPILNATRIVAAMERRTERRERPERAAGRPEEERRDEEKMTEPAGPTETKTRPVNLEPTRTKIDHAHAHREEKIRTRSEIPRSGERAPSTPPARPPEPAFTSGKTPDDNGTLEAASERVRQKCEAASRDSQAARAWLEALNSSMFHVPQAETPGAVSTSDRDTMTDVSTDLDDLRANMKSLLMQIAQHRMELKEKESMDRQTTIENLTESSATQLQATLVELNANKQALDVAQREITETRDLMTKEARKSAEENRALKQSLAISNEQNASLVSERENANIEQGVSAFRHSEQITLIRQLGLTLEAARLDIASKEAALHDVETREAALRGTSDVQAKQNSDLCATRDRMTTELDSAEAEYKTIKTIVDKMTQDQRTLVEESAAKTKDHLDEIGELQLIIKNLRICIDDLEKTGNLRKDTIDDLSSRLDKANEQLGQVGEITALPKPAAEPGSTVYTWLIRMEAMATRWVLSHEDGTGPMAAMVATVACSVMFLFYGVRHILPRDTMGALCDTLHTIYKWMVRPTRRDERIVQPGMWVVGQYLAVFAKALLTLLVLYLVCSPPIERAQIASNATYEYVYMPPGTLRSWTRNETTPQLVRSFDILGFDPKTKDTRGFFRLFFDFLKPAQSRFTVEAAAETERKNAEAKAKQEEEKAKAKQEEERLKREAAKAKQEEERLKREAAKAKQEEERLKREAAKAKQEEEKRLKREAAEKATLEEEKRLKREAAEKATLEEEERLKREAAKAKREAALKQQEEAAARRAHSNLINTKAAIEGSLRGTRVDEYTRLAAATGDANLVSDWLSRLATLDASQVEQLQPTIAAWIATGMEYDIGELEKKEAAQKKATEAAQKKADPKKAEKKATVVDQEKADEVTAARKLTAWPTLGEENQQRVLTQLHLYHVAAVIVGSTSEEEFTKSSQALGEINNQLPWTNLATLFRNFMVHIEELMAYIAANEPENAIQKLAEDLTNGNQYGWPSTAGNYTTEANVLERLNKATPQTVNAHFPALRYVSGSPSANLNGLFDGCNTALKDRCDLLAELYRGYAGTMIYEEEKEAVKQALVASLERAKKTHTGTSVTKLFDRTIADITNGKIDKLSVIIAATAHLGEGGVLYAVRLLIVYYHVQIMRIPKASTDPAFIAAVKYTEKLVYTSARPNNAQYVCNLARTLEQTLKSLTEENVSRDLSFHHTHRIIARTWVDIEYIKQYELLQTDEKKEALYKEAASIVDNLKTDLRELTISDTRHTSIVAYIKYKLNDNKRK
jgi:hypothetical protein